MERLEEGHEIGARAVVLATGAAYRRLPLTISRTTRVWSVFYAAGPPEAQTVWRLAALPSSAAAIPPGKPLLARPRGSARNASPPRGADLAETMSDYLIHELDRFGVAVRDRSEIATLHGASGAARGGHAESRRAAPVLGPVLLPPAPEPCTGWLDDAVSHAAADGFILTGDAVGADYLLETSVPGIFASGDVRSGSSKRCAAAVGEGSMAVQFVHQHLARPTARVR